MIFKTRPNVIWRTGLLACAVIALATGLAFAQGPHHSRKLDRAVSSARQGSRAVGVILRVVPGREKEVRAALKERRLTLDDEMPSVGGMRAVLAPNDIDVLAGLDAVEGISADAVVNRRRRHQQEDEFRHDGDDDVHLGRDRLVECLC